MKEKLCLTLGFILHIISVIFSVLSIVVMFTDGDASGVAYVETRSFMLWERAIITVTFAMLFYIVDALLSLFGDFSFFSVIKILMVLAGVGVLSLCAVSPTQNNQIIWFVFSKLLFFLQIKSFSRDYD